MEGYGPTTYGESFADVYDDWYAEITDVEATVAKLVELAVGEPVLELGVGTGRVAIPLADRGLIVWGVDASEEMLAGMASRPGGDRVVAVRADMADMELGDGAPPFGVAFAAFNTFFNLTSRDAQARCLSKLGDALAPGARLVIEAFVPADLGGRAGTDVGVHAISLDRVVLSAIRLDPVEQTVSGQYVDISEQGIRLRPWMIRWALPDEIDALAGEAGFRLSERSANWTGEPFRDTSPTHVSVYVRE
ncbi:MAG: class I SAM-dependent DNA methyltransferase [Acidimicrobiales bacterium]